MTNDKPLAIALPTTSSGIRTDNARRATVRTAVLTVFALAAFAANSLLCRLALGGDSIDAASFTSIRLSSGALALWMLVKSAGAPSPSRAPDRVASGMLFLYAIAFSFAYATLSAGTGALILFGTVQATMLAAALRSGERFTLSAWIGLALAVAGLVYLVLPGATAPPLGGATLMAIAGMAWGCYTLQGRGGGDPLHITAANFVQAVPPALMVNLLFVAQTEVSARGVILAVASGAIASGAGYVVWYTALRNLSATRAAAVQLAVPVMAAFGGVIFLNETLTGRLLVSTTAILAGIGIVLAQRMHRLAQR